MKLTLLGAGAVGLALGARLARAGHDVTFAVRRPEVARAISRDGVEVWDPGSDERFRAPAAAVVGCAAAPLTEGPVLVCVRSPQTRAAAAELADAAPGATAVSVQNDVGNEALLAARLRRVLGAVYRQTCTRTADAAVTALGPGRIVLGAWPAGTGPDVLALAEALRGAGYDTGVSERIAEDKWLKLCVNLMSATNALVRREEHATPAFVEAKARALEEARDVLRAACIRATSCDGRDRSLEAEIAWQRESLARGSSARALPVYNQVWQSLDRHLPLESDAYHRRIVELGARHGVPTPVNARILAVLAGTWRSRRGPESVSARELLEPERER